MSAVIDSATSGLFSFLDGLFNRMSERLDTLKVRYQSTDFHYTITRQVEFSNTKREIDNPTAKFESNQKKDVRLVGCQVIFDTPPADEYRPRLMIALNKASLIMDTFIDEDTENPFLNADLDLDFSTGMTLTPNDFLDFYFWFDGTDAGDKKATISLTFGEY